MPHKQQICDRFAHEERNYIILLIYNVISINVENILLQISTLKFIATK